MRALVIGLLLLAGCFADDDYAQGKPFERGAEERIEAVCAGHASCSDQPFTQCKRQLDDRLGNAAMACTDCLRDLDCSQWSGVRSHGLMCALCKACGCSSQPCRPESQSVPGSTADPCRQNTFDCPSTTGAMVDTCRADGFWSGTCVCRPHHDAGPSTEFDAGP